jgi:hypothetical protein
MSYEAFVPLTPTERARAKEVCPNELAKLELIEEALGDLDGTILMATDRMEQPE